MGYGHKNSTRGGSHLTEQLLSIARGSAALHSVCVCARVCVRVSALACVSSAPHLPLVTAPLGSELRLS